MRKWDNKFLKLKRVLYAGAGSILKIKKYSSPRISTAIKYHGKFSTVE